MNLDQGIATLLAAIIAAFLSLLTFLSSKPTEVRAAHRKHLENYIFDISDSVHQLIAISNIFLKNKSSESKNNWIVKAEISKKKLQDIRPKIRYPLWGLDKYLLSLTRLPDYTLYCLENPNVAKEIVKKGTRLGNKLDKCIRDCYLNGRRPRFYSLWLLKFYNWRFEKVRNDFKAKKETAKPR